MKTLRICLWLLLLSTISLTVFYFWPYLLAPKNRAAIATEADYFGDSVNHITYLQQEWSPADSLFFYTTSLGSNLIPYEIFLQLEQAESTRLFRSNENMLRYRYLVQESSHQNPEGLPLGLVQDHYQGIAYIGFTCAGCHTAQINYQGTGIRIDGAPGLTDLDTMLTDLTHALQTTLDDRDKLTRLSERLYGEATQDTLKTVSAQLLSAYQALNTDRQRNFPPTDKPGTHAGFGRLDALGRSFNQVLALLTPSDANNANPANAPVNFPSLWYTPHFDVVQWSQENPHWRSRRNVSKALGLFPSLDLQHQNQDGGYPSSVNVRNIENLEKRLVTLQAPPWPTQFPAIDSAKAARGRNVFLKYQCGQCHTDATQRKTNADIQTQFISLPYIGTDAMRATNAATHQGKSGYLEGLPISSAQLDSAQFSATMPVAQLLTAVGRGILSAPNPDQPVIMRSFLRGLDNLLAPNPQLQRNSERQLNFQPNRNPAEYSLSYKAPILNGIWATAPYLHNGSVNSLYQMFLPICAEETVDAIQQHPPCRAITFSVGSREFDPVHVGYTSKDPKRFPSLFIFDTRLPGNSNAGHQFTSGETPVIQFDNQGKPRRNEDGTFKTQFLPAISDHDRWALVEYLKTL